MTGLHVLEVEWMGLRTTWPPLVGWSLRLTREARVVQVVQGKHFVHTHTHTHTHTTHTRRRSIPPHDTWGSPFLYAEFWKNGGPNPVWISVEFGKKVGSGDSQSWLQFTVDKLLGQYSFFFT